MLVWQPFLICLLIHASGCVQLAPSAIHGFTALLEKSLFDNATSLPIIPAETEVKIRLYGKLIHQVEHIAFSPHAPLHENGICDLGNLTKSFILHTEANGIIWSSVNLQEATTKPTVYYLCAQMRNSSDIIFTQDTWLYQGKLALQVEYRARYLLPLGIQIVLVCILLFTSGLFSGLNLGLMSLNVSELQMMEKVGSKSEKYYASRIRPVRKHGNFLLCSLLLGNVLVNTTLTIFMDDLTGSGLYAVIASTFGITIFGEIIPQAIGSRYGMAMGAYTIYFTRAVMLLMGVVALPLAWILNRLLGKEMGQEYTREKLRELIAQQGQAGHMEADEIQMMTGALTFTGKCAGDAMTPLEYAFMVSLDTVLTFDTVSDILNHGFTRVPVYDGRRENIKFVLNVKDLTLIDPSENVPLATVCNFYQRGIWCVDQKMSLLNVLDVFKTGKTHMAFVKKHRQTKEKETGDGNGDNKDKDGKCSDETQPLRASVEVKDSGEPHEDAKIIGFITLEDVIEEILQVDIEDENGLVNGQGLQAQNQLMVHENFKEFVKVQQQSKQVRLTPQLKIAVQQYLIQNVESFQESYIDKCVLRNLLETEVVVNHTLEKSASKNVVYERHQECNFIVFIIQGTAQVEVTCEKLTFRAGPFMLFGEAMLNELNRQLESENVPQSDWSSLRRADFPTWRPEHTLTATSELQFLKLTASQYFFARRQSVLLRLQQTVQGHCCDSVSSEAGSNGDATSVSEVFLEAWRKFNEIEEREDEESPLTGDSSPAVLTVPKQTANSPPSPKFVNSNYYHV